MKKFKDLTEQYREEGRFKPVITHNVKSTGVGPRPQVDSAKTKLKEEDQLDEGRPSQRHPLEGHDYHKKSNAELVGIAKDAHEAAEAMKSHNTTAENKYRDQANDSATVRYFRQKNGMPDWYKKKYGHMKEETDTSEKTEMAQTQLHFMKYAADEILEYIEMGGEIEEWYQNKLSKVMSDVESLHSYVEGESRRTGMKEESELDEAMNRQERERAADTQAARERAIANNPKIAAEIERRRKAAEEKKKQQGMAEESELDEARMSAAVKLARAADRQQAKSTASLSRTPSSIPKKEEPKKQGVAEGSLNEGHYEMMMRNGQVKKFIAKDDADAKRIAAGHGAKSVIKLRGGVPAGKVAEQGVAEETEDLQESRRANIVREAMEAAKKKKKQQQEQQSTDKFNADPTLSSEIVKS